ncbi:hypothetical protein ORJ04_16195 [Rheinheimera baltica]|uniref:Uncharacterized protein n=1 Tax=Rheinheimera baltica TaxID=67576 RepID=A0ABT9I282_9GAMM|nr:hypothetical protein [Rheinheimera baltica]MDP5137498.1 hypothetical protein [Rheinheimera baltica]
MMLEDNFAVAKAACQYLSQQVQDDGQFVYLRSAKGKHLTHKPYNMLRHCGSIWAMAAFLRLEPDATTEQKCLAALGFARRETVKCSSPEAETDLLFVLDRKSIAKLGGNALIYLAFDSFADQDPLFKQGLLHGLRFFLTPEGLIKFSKFDPYTGIAADFVSEYYPGEAALALCTAGDFDTAYRMITTLRDTRDKVKMTQDHWLMQALEVIILHYLPMKTPEATQRVQFCLQYLHDLYQQIFTNRVYLGRNTPVACRAEGILSYLAVLHAVGDVQRYIGVRLFLQQLMQELRSYQVTDGVLAGAFLDHNKARIDYTQHSLSVFTRFVAYQAAGIL